VTPTLALLPSPLLGPAAWAPVARRLAAMGWPVVVPPPGSNAPRHPDDVVETLLAGLPADQPLVLIPHSNAGAYVPAVTAAREVVGFVFVDARLPDSVGPVPMAASGMLDALAAMADADGLLPPWTAWWAEEDVAPLFPDRPTRDDVEAGQPRLPLSYFRESAAAPVGWDGRPGAYLAFGDTYADERQAAIDRGWPARTLPGRHLHMLHDPDQVAAEIISLLAKARVFGPPD